jgi:hypothetical protein
LSVLHVVHPGGFLEIRNCWFMLSYFERACDRAARVFCSCFTPLQTVTIMSMVPPTVDRVSEIVLGFQKSLNRLDHDSVVY